MHHLTGLRSGGCITSRGQGVMDASPTGVKEWRIHHLMGLRSGGCITYDVKEWRIQHLTGLRSGG